MLQHSFKEADRLTRGQTLYGPTVEYYGLQWYIAIYKIRTQVVVFLRADSTHNTDAQSIDLSCDFCLLSRTGARWCTQPDFVYSNAYCNTWSAILHDWNTVRKSLVVNDVITMMVRVNIEKMSGVYKPDLRMFDATMREFSDVILVVQDKEFYVLKQFLALHSPFFNTLLLGVFVEAQQTRVTLNNICASDFQKFLELLYGDWSIDEFTVESLLSLADMYDTQIVRQKCQQFLVNTSQKTLATKRRLAEKYNLEELQAQCGRELHEDEEQQMP